MQEVHRTGTFESIGLILLGGFFVLIAVGFFVLWFAGVRQWREPYEIATLVIGSIIAGPVLIIWGLRNTLFRQSILVFSNGLARIRFGKVHIFPWDQIASLFKNKEAIHLQHLNGSRLSFNGLSKESTEKLRKLAEDEIWKRLLPAVQKQYEEGLVFSFGKLGICKDGLIVSDRMLPWDQIAGICLDPDERLLVSKKGGILSWASIPIKRIPNFQIVRFLIERHIAVGQMSS